jgi:membrane glycosyltransferase
VWGSVLFFINRYFFWWMVPVLAPLLFAVPISVWSSRVSLGYNTRKLGLFLVPEEISPPPELAMAWESRQHQQKNVLSSLQDTSGFVQAIVDPIVNGMHLAFRRQKPNESGNLSNARHQLVLKALSDGPESLRQEEKMDLLSDPASLTILHRLVWELPSGDAARKWGFYN